MNLSDINDTDKEQQVWAEFNEARKKFLEQEAQRFFEGYRVTKSETLHSVYKKLLEARQRM